MKFTVSSRMFLTCFVCSFVSILITSDAMPIVPIIRLDMNLSLSELVRNVMSSSETCRLNVIYPVRAYVLDVKIVWQENGNLSILQGISSLLWHFREYDVCHLCLPKNLSILGRKFHVSSSELFCFPFNAWIFEIGRWNSSWAFDAVEDCFRELGFILFRNYMHYSSKFCTPIDVLIIASRRRNFMQ